jgi:hypothetical protein
MSPNCLKGAFVQKVWKQWREGWIKGLMDGRGKETHQPHDNKKGIWKGGREREERN